MTPGFMLKRALLGAARVLVGCAVPFLIMLIMLGAKYGAYGKGYNETRDAMLRVASLDFDLTLLENGDGRMVERWQIDLPDGKGYGGHMPGGLNLALKEMRLNCANRQNLAVEDVAVRLNDQPLAAVSDWQSDAREGAYCVEDNSTEYSDGTVRRRTSVVFRYDHPGRNVIEISYDIRGVVSGLSDGAALGYNFFSAGDYCPNRLSARISLPGRRLSDAATSLNITGFKGAGGFDGDGCTAYILGHMAVEHTVEVAMTFPEGVFAAGLPADGEAISAARFVQSHPPATDVLRHPVSLSMGRVISAAPAAAIALAALTLAAMIACALWTTRRLRDGADDQDILRGERRFAHGIAALLALLAAAAVLATGALGYTAKFVVMYFAIMPALILMIYFIGGAWEIRLALRKI